MDWKTLSYTFIFMYFCIVNEAYILFYFVPSANRRIALLFLTARGV